MATRLGFILGARGGARGHNPFPAPRTDRFVRGNAKVEHAGKPRQEVNHSLQPWQRHDLKMRGAVRLGWNSRREAREARRAHV